MRQLAELRFQNAKLEKEIKALLANEEADRQQIAEAETNLESYKRDIELNDAIETELEDRLRTVAADLQVMKEHPLIPGEYKKEVDERAAQQMSKIQDLEAQIAEYHERVAVAKETTQVLEEDIQISMAARDKARSIAAAHHSQVSMTNAECTQIDRKKALLEHKIQNIPTRTVVREVTKENIVEKFPETPFSDEYILEKCFDMVDTAVKGFIQTSALTSRVRTLSSYDKSMVSLLHRCEVTIRCATNSCSLLLLRPSNRLCTTEMISSNSFCSGDGTRNARL